MVRAADLKFQWAPTDDSGDLDFSSSNSERFNTEKSAFVRKLEFRAGDNPRIRSASLSLVPAHDAVMDSKIQSGDKTAQDLVTPSNLVVQAGSNKKFVDKAEWFQDTCAKLWVDWNEGHMRMNVRRKNLLQDSIDAVMSLSNKGLRKLWRFEFIGEMGISGGGCAREWYYWVCQDLFDPAMGLWKPNNQGCLIINPDSGTS